MRNAGSRYAKRILFTGLRRPAGDGVATQSASPARADGIDAPAIRLLIIVATLALAAAAMLQPATAGAALRHPAQTLAFGPNAVPNQKFNDELLSTAYDQANDKLYVLARYKGEKGRIFGFSHPAEGVFQPIPGFPIEVPTVYFNPRIAVDNSSGPHAGRIYLLQSWETNETRAVRAYEPNGQEVTNGFPIFTIRRACGIAVDPTGHVWVSFSSGEDAILEFDGGGTQVASHSTPVVDPCHMAFDPSTMDLYLSEGASKAWRLPAATGYTEKVGPFVTLPSNSEFAFENDTMEGLTFDGATHTLYAASSSIGKYLNGVAAYAPDGRRLERFGAQENRKYSGVAVDEDTGEVMLSDFKFTYEEANPGIVRVFRPVVVPDVITGPQRGNDEATGSVNRAGAGQITSCKVEFATDVYYRAHKNRAEEEYETAKSVPCEPPAPFDEDREVSAVLPVANETLYHYRLVAGNANGKMLGDDQLLEPHYVDSLHTKPATAITRTTATLNASFEGTGEDTTYHFEWGKSSLPNPFAEHESAPVTLVAPTGAEQISEPISNLIGGTIYSFRIVAENAKGESAAQPLTFQTSLAIKNLETLPATNVETTTAQLNGSLDPDNLETHYYFEYGKTTAYGQTVPAPPGALLDSSSPGSVHVGILLTNLEPGAGYHFRLVGTNETGETRGDDQFFETPQPPSINTFGSRNVTATSAELLGQIKPNGYATTYYFEYGPTSDYGQKVPVPAGTLTGDDEAHDVVVELSGLNGGTYHFRLVAENEWGKTETDNQSFDFFAPKSCPNHVRRQQTGAAYLPDCRAYELVSSPNARGALLFSGGPSGPYASSPARFTYGAAFNSVPDSGDPINGTFTGDLYVSTRTTGGWTTRYLGIPAYRSSFYSGIIEESFQSPLNSIPSDLGMNKFLIWDRGAEGTSQPSRGTNSPYIYDNQGNEIGQLPTTADEVPGALTDKSQGGWTGAGRPSADFSHYFFSTKDLVFANGGLTAAPGSVYDNDISADSVVLVSKTEGGDDIPRDSGPGEEFIRIPAVSRDGTHVLMSTITSGGRTHLYMAVNRGDHYDHYEVSEGKDGTNHGVAFEGMAANGGTVYFTSDEQLTADDTDSVTDLYMWTEEGNEVTRISTGFEGAGNQTSCGLSSCAVEVVPSDLDAGGNTFTRDTTYGSENRTIYFYSAEQLDGSRGIPGKKNLYTFHNGRVQFVATFENSTAPVRMNVSPDGRYMAMLSKAQLTSYSNLSYRQMYAYNADSRRILCVSCRPDGAPPGSDAEASKDGLFMTADGRVFFATKDSLIPRDANGSRDVYEYSEGRPQLISSGAGEGGGAVEFFGDEFATGLVGVSLDGTDVYFSTLDTLVPQDENGPFLKFYDARTNGGFTVTREAAPCAAADECHGRESPTAQQPLIGTGAALGTGGNLHPSSKRKRCRSKTGKKRCHSKKRGHHRRKSGGNRG